MNDKQIVQCEMLTDGSLFLAVKALLDGAYDHGLVLTSDEAIALAISAAMAFAIDTEGVGKEDIAIDRTYAVISKVEAGYRQNIEAGLLKGRSRGGHRRRFNRKLADF